MPITTAYIDRYCEILTRAGLSKADRYNRLSALLMSVNPAHADQIKGMTEIICRQHGRKRG